MPRSGVLGTYSLPPGTTPQQPNTVIQSAMFNAFADDIAQTQNTPTPIAYGGTNAATPEGSRASLGVDDLVFDAVGYIPTGGGPNALTVTSSRNIANYLGEVISIQPAANNTSGVTLNLNGLGVKPVLRFNVFGNESALVANDLIGTNVYRLIYFPTAASGSGAWIVTNPSIEFAGTYTPSLTATSGSFSNATGTVSYRKVGKVVHCVASISIVAVGTAAGRLRLNTPLTSASVTFAGSGGGVSTAARQVNVLVGGSSTIAEAIYYDGTSVIENGASISISFSYIVD